MTAESGRPAKDRPLRSRKRSRPLTAAQELLFFGVSFAVVVVLQVVFLLNFADVIDW